MDTVVLALFAGFILSATMTQDRKLFKATRNNATMLAVGYFIALIALAGIDGCNFILGFLRIESTGPAVLTARENFTTHVLGIEPVNQVSAIAGSVGFVLSTSGTQSKKWLAIGIALGALFLYIVYRTVLPT